MSAEDPDELDADEAELTRPKTSTRTLVLAVVVGILAVLIIAAAAYLRPGPEEGSETSAPAEAAEGR
ncbi:MAG TPA: hypothetical protein RMH99_14400 [Sandaracinaceae bacterium LLY-WYZ-13_1]|nr:hypothetical protein [Sandaracinaceae bacterium LLY-WYZ-13_1]